MISVVTIYKGIEKFSLQAHFRKKYTCLHAKKNIYEHLQNMVTYTHHFMFLPHLFSNERLESMSMAIKQNGKEFVSKIYIKSQYLK